MYFWLPNDCQIISIRTPCSEIRPVAIEEKVLEIINKALATLNKSLEGKTITLSLNPLLAKGMAKEILETAKNLGEAKTNIDTLMTDIKTEAEKQAANTSYEVSCPAGATTYVFTAKPVK